MRKGREWLHWMPFSFWVCLQLSLQAVSRMSTSPPWWIKSQPTPRALIALAPPLFSPSKGMFILLGMKFGDLLESLEVLNDNAVALIYFSCLSIAWFFVLFFFFFLDVCVLVFVWVFGIVWFCWLNWIFLEHSLFFFMCIQFLEELLDPIVSYRIAL